MHALLTPEAIGSLITLTVLEIVLGIDNIIFLTILVDKLHESQRPLARRLGLILALGMRIVLLLGISFLASMTKPLFTVMGHDIAGRDLVLMFGGVFLIGKSTWELFSGLEGEEDKPVTGAQAKKLFLVVLAQVVVMDIVFSLDSVITAVGLAQHVEIMILAMVLAMGVMQVFAKPVGEFVTRHPSMKILALGFLIMIGTLLVAEGGGQHVNKGYVYFAMSFSFALELINIRSRRRAVDVKELHTAPVSMRVRSSMPSLSDQSGNAKEAILKAVAGIDDSRIEHSALADSEQTVELTAKELRKVIEEQTRRIIDLEKKLGLR